MTIQQWRQGKGTRIAFGVMDKERLAGVAASTKPTGGEKEDTADHRREQNSQV